MFVIVLVLPCQIMPAMGNTILVMKKLEADRIIERKGPDGWKYVAPKGQL